MRVSEIPEAREVIIELGGLCGDLRNLKDGWYRVVGGKEAFLKSVVRRAKYEHLLWRVMAKAHIGILPKQVVYDRQELAWEMPYRVLSASPDGEVQITPKPRVVVKIWDCGNPDCPSYQKCYE